MWRNVGCFLGLVSLILTHLVFHFPCRYKIWHYTGKLLHEKTVGELWEVGLSKKNFFLDTIFYAENIGKSVKLRLLDYYEANEVTGFFLFIRLSGSRFKTIYSRNQLSVTRPSRP